MVMGAEDFTARPKLQLKENSSGLLDVANFLRDKLAWHQQIVWDPGITMRAKVVAAMLLHDLDPDRGGAYPSQLTMSRRAGCGVRTIQKALDELCAGGFLEVEVLRGRGRTNLYRALKKASPGAGYRDKNTSPGSPFAPENPHRAARFEAQKANSGAAKRERGYAQTLIENPIERCARTWFAADWVREAFIKRLGEPFVGAWLDGSEWDESRSAIIPRTALAYQRLNQEVPIRWLTERGLTLINPATGVGRA